MWRGHRSSTKQNGTLRYSSVIHAQDGDVLGNPTVLCPINPVQNAVLGLLGREIRTGRRVEAITEQAWWEEKRLFNG